MARKLRMIAPFDSASGNLSGAQKLLYAKNNNPSWDAPVGKNAARNYKTRYVGVYRAATGTSTFAVRTKNIANNSEKMRRYQALFGGSAACYVAASMDLMIITKLQSAYQRARESRPSLTFRKWLTDFMYSMLDEKLVSIGISTPLGNVSINNPWIEGGSGTTDLDISNEVLAKFWTYLANDPITFHIEGSLGVAHSGDTFADVVESSYNVCNLTLETVTGQDYKAVKMAGMYVGDASAEEGVASVLDGSTIDAGKKYVLTETFQEAG